ncbi:MAG: hypothetical protein RL499_1039, partial [Actinomycetota bacterium]
PGEKVRGGQAAEPWGNTATVGGGSTGHQRG